MDYRLQSLLETEAGPPRPEPARPWTVRGLGRLARDARRALAGQRPALEKAYPTARGPRFRGGRDWAVRLYAWTGVAGLVIFALGRLLFY